MNPLAFGGVTEELLRRRRTQSTTDDLPAIPRDSCPAVLFDLLPQVEIWPAVAREKPEGAVVCELSEVNCSLIRDLPLPVIVCRRRIALITLVDNGLCTQRTRQWPARADIDGSCPQTIFVSRRCAVTMALVEWLDGYISTLKLGAGTLYPVVLILSWAEDARKPLPVRVGLSAAHGAFFVHPAARD